MDQETQTKSGYIREEGYDSIFQKYKIDHKTQSFPFKIYSANDQNPYENIEQKQGRGSYRKYTVDEKLQAVEKILNGCDVKKISSQYGIPRRNLLRWRKNGCQRKQGGGRPTDQEIIINQSIVGQKNIRQQAKRLSNSNNFKASKGWYTKFCRRHRNFLELQTSYADCDSKKQK